MTAVAILLGLTALASWLVAVFSFISLLQHRAPGVGLWTLLASGYRSLQAKSYAPSGAPLLRRLRWAFVVFFASVIAIALLAAALGAADATL